MRPAEFGVFEAPGSVRFARLDATSQHLQRSAPPPHILMPTRYRSQASQGLGRPRAKTRFGQVSEALVGVQARSGCVALLPRRHRKPHTLVLTQTSISIPSAQCGRVVTSFSFTVPDGVASRKNDFKSNVGVAA